MRFPVCGHAHPQRVGYEGAVRLVRLMQRLATRTSNPFGKSPDELRRVLDDVQAIEPLLRRVADHEVRTTAPLHEVVTTILGIVDA